MIVIDGHNLLFELYELENDNFLRSLDDLKSRIHRIAEAKKKNIILVLDGSGGKGARERTEMMGMFLKIVYSGVSESADDWIEGWAHRNTGGSHLLVSRDKKLVQRIGRPDLETAEGGNWIREMQRSEIREIKKDFGSLDEWLEEFS